CADKSGFAAKLVRPLFAIGGERRTEGIDGCPAAVMPLERVVTGRIDIAEGVKLGEQCTLHAFSQVLGGGDHKSAASGRVADFLYHALIGFYSKRKSHRRPAFKGGRRPDGVRSFRLADKLRRGYGPANFLRIYTH